MKLLPLLIALTLPTLPITCKPEPEPEPPQFVDELPVPIAEVRPLRMIRDFRAFEVTHDYSCTVSGNEITMHTTAYRDWPGKTVANGKRLTGNIVVFWEVSGQWYAASHESTTAAGKPRGVNTLDFDHTGCREWPYPDGPPSGSVFYGCLMTLNRDPAYLGTDKRTKIARYVIP